MSQGVSACGICGISMLADLTHTCSSSSILGTSITSHPVYGNTVPNINYEVKKFPIVMRSEMIKPFDVDGTLVNPWDPSVNYDQVSVYVNDPLTGKFIRMAVHEPMLRLLEEEHHRGSCVVVWSRGGYQWAENVITALGIINKVDLIMSKPMVYFDDLPVSEWMKDRVYMTPETKYKK